MEFPEAFLVMLHQIVEHFEKGVELLFALFVVLQSEMYLGEVKEEGDEHCAKLYVLVVGEVAQCLQRRHGALHGVHISLFRDELFCGLAAFERFLENVKLPGAVIEFLKHEWYLNRCHI